METIFEPRNIKEELKKTDLVNFERYTESDSFNILHNSVKDRVLSILKRDRLSRKNDMWLCLLYWIKSGQIKLVIPLSEFYKINKPESISRCRRELIKEAKSGVKELQFLLNDQETLLERENLKNLNTEYFSKN